MTILSYVFLALYAIIYGAGNFIKNKKWLLATHLISGVLYILSMFLLSAVFAAVISIFNNLRVLVFYIIELKNGNKKTKLYAGLALFVVSIFCSYFSWNGWFSLLPIISSFIVLISLTISNELFIKFTVLINSTALTTYLLLSHLYIAAGIESLAILNALVGLILTFVFVSKNKKKQNKSEQETKDKNKTKQVV